MDAGEDGLGLLLEEVDQQDGEGVRWKGPLRLSVQRHETRPVPEGHPECVDPLVQTVVVPQQAASLGGLEVVQTQLAVEVAVGRESDGRDLGCEVLRHRVEVTKQRISISMTKKLFFCFLTSKASGFPEL